jgi:hypothetical protein
MTAVPVPVTLACLAAAVTVIACGVASAAAHVTQRHGAAQATGPRFARRRTAGRRTRSAAPSCCIGAPVGVGWRRTVCKDGGNAEIGERGHLVALIADTVRVKCRN